MVEQGAKCQSDMVEIRELLREVHTIHLKGPYSIDLVDDGRADIYYETAPTPGRVYQRRAESLVEAYRWIKRKRESDKKVLQGS